jgi:hypothetical protein
VNIPQLIKHFFYEMGKLRGLKTLLVQASHKTTVFLKVGMTKD